MPVFDGLRGLCVGGPLASRRFHLMMGRRLAIPSHEIVYEMQDWDMPGGSISLLVPEGQSHVETFILLLESYLETAIRDEMRRDPR
jgi:hypothetical protein